MITVTDAISIINKKQITAPRTSVKNLDDAVNFILFESVFSPINMPPFRQSAMDGYAICKKKDANYNLIGEIKAGDSHQVELKQGDAVRIFTGAPVPDTADAVMMQEKVTPIDSSSITINETDIPIGLNIRPIGEQVKKGQLVLEKGSRLTPASIGFLEGLGLTEVSVYKQPKITLIVTGDELIEAGQTLSYGKIYESNSSMLHSALLALGYTSITIQKIKDDFKATKNTIDKAITTSDVVINSGGISVGDYDFVGQALQELEVETLFYKVKQKPGKPLFYGEKGSTSIFALPGNPAASLTCFYIYVYPVLKLHQGDSNPHLTRIKSPLLSNYIKKGDRAQFLKAVLDVSGVEILDGQSSAMLHSFSSANALIYIPETVSTINQGDFVEVIVLP
jgi:molybdopterin molybdotransferase